MKKITLWICSLAITLAACQGTEKKSETEEHPTSEAPAASAPKEDPVEEQPMDSSNEDDALIDTDTVKKMEQAVEKKNTKTNKMVLIKTRFGNMKVRLYDETPKHRDNFIKLVNEGFYDDLLFHRVIPNFMIQGGDPNSRGAAPGTQLGSGGPGYTIPAEFNTKFFHKKGALSAARLGDNMNPQKASSGSQFYIVQGQKYTEQQLKAFQVNYGMSFTPEQIAAYTTVGGTPHLDNNYTVFGEVVEGLDVIDKIAAVQTAPGDRPVEDVTMTIIEVK